MTTRAIRFGVIHEESADKGPYKLATVMADGKPMDCEIADLTGIEGSPLKDSRVLLLTPDGDDGKAIGIVYGPPVKDRTDGQKPGEVTYKNHKTGNKIVHDKDGNTQMKTAKDVVEDIGQNQTTKAAGTIKINTGGLLLLNC